MLGEEGDGCVLMKQMADCFQLFWYSSAQGWMCVKASVVKVTPPCQKMAGVECGCGLGPGPPAQEELLLFRNYADLRYGRAGNRDFGNLNA